MKLKLRLILILVVCVLSLPVFADNREEQFWQTISRGDYLAAGQLAANIGATNSEYYYLAGICYQNSFRYRESNLYFQKYGRFGNPVKLGNLLKDRIQKSKSDPEVLILAGIAGILETNLGLDDPTKYLEQAGRKLKGNAFTNNYLALFKIKQQDYSDTTKKLLVSAINQKKDLPESYNNLAVVYYRNGEMQRAVDTLLECLANCPQSPENTFASLVNLTAQGVVLTLNPCDSREKPVMLEAPGLDDEVRDKIKTALAQNPYHLLELAEYFTKNSNPVEAEALVQGIEFKDDQGLYDYVKFQIAKLNGAREEMESIGNQIIAGNVLDYERLFQCGVVLFDAGDPVMAEKFFEATLPKIHPADENYLLQCYSNMGSCYYVNKEYDKAVVHFKKALEYYPEDTISLINLGLTYRDLGDKVNAAVYLKRALESSPDEEQQAEAEKYLEGLKE